jgi:hypothetical protein
LDCRAKGRRILKISGAGECQLSAAESSVHVTLLGSWYMYLVLDARFRSNYRPISRVQLGVGLKRETREDREEVKGLDMSVGT